jgi:hypothetical protein
VNNGIIKVSRDGGANWTSIQLENGVYSVNQISQAVYTAVSSGWIDAADPGILIRSNSALQRCYIILDTTKSGVPNTQLAIDLSGSLIYQVLGFSATKLFDTDGTKTGDVYPQINYIGNKLSVELLGFGYLSTKNGGNSNEFFQVNLATSSVTNLYTFPSSEQPYIKCTPQYQISNYGIRIVGSNSQRPVYILEGEISLTFELIQV